MKVCNYVTVAQTVQSPWKFAIMLLVLIQFRAHESTVCHFVLYTDAHTVQSPWKYANLLAALLPKQCRAHESMSFCALHCCQYSSEPINVCHFVGCTVANTVQSPWQYAIFVGLTFANTRAYLAIAVLHAEVISTRVGQVRVVLPVRVICKQGPIIMENQGKVTSKCNLLFRVSVFWAIQNKCNTRYLCYFLGCFNRQCYKCQANRWLTLLT